MHSGKKKPATPHRRTPYKLRRPDHYPTALLHQPSPKMSSSSPTDNGAFGWDHKRTHHHGSSSRHHAPVDGSPSPSELHWPNGPYQESHTRPGIVPTTNPWPSTSFLDPHFTAYGGSVFSSGRRVDEAYPGPSFGAPDRTDPKLGVNDFMRWEITAPMLEQPFLVEQRAFHAPQHCPPPSSTWIAPQPSWQPSPAWNHPVRTAGQYGGQSSSIGSLDMPPSNPHSQVASSFLSTGYSEHRMIPTGYSPPSMRSLTPVIPVAIAAHTSQAHEERSDPSLSADTFQCLWRSGGTRCTALIKGDRRSITSHLRDVHAFTCDGLTIACAWGQCTAPMQRRNIPRHIIACHLEMKFQCPACPMILSRPDAIRKHRPACPGLRMTEVRGRREGDDGR